MRDFGRINNRGTTLVELLATMAILSLIMTPISIMVYNGYKTYFEEHDKMMALGAANDAIEIIINDLRKYETSATTIVSTTGEKITLNDTLEYFYDKTQKAIKRNGINIFTDSPDIKVVSFNVHEKSEVTYDSKLIVISLSIEFGKSGEINLSNEYRRRN